MQTAVILKARNLKIVSMSDVDKQDQLPTINSRLQTINSKLQTPLVGIIMGSDSDLPVMNEYVVQF